VIEVVDDTELGRRHFLAEPTKVFGGRLPVHIEVCAEKRHRVRERPALALEPAKRVTEDVQALSMLQATEEHQVIVVDLP
jgi:hypothetical protein